MRRAFTLIETLVVMSIIGTLVAIMLPVLERSRRQAQDVTGFVNLGVLSQTMSGYVTDHKDAYLAPFRGGWPQYGPYKGMTWTMACSEADPVTMRWDFARPRYAELNTEGFSKVWYSFLAEYRGGRRDDRRRHNRRDGRQWCAPDCRRWLGRRPGLGQAGMQALTPIVRGRHGETHGEDLISQPLPIIRHGRPPAR